MDPETSELAAKDMELERRSHDLARRIRIAGRGDHEEAKEELTKIATEQFEVRQQLRERHARRLEEQTQEIKASLQKRAERKNEIIERRIGDLLGQPRDVDF